MWLVDVNETDVWPVNNIKITDGKRNIDDFIYECKKSQLIKKLDLDDQKNFFVVLGDALNLNEQTLINTLTIYEDNDSLIQFCYHQDYTNFHEPKINYFSTIINNTSEIIFGKACFFRVDRTTKKLIDLSLETLLTFLVNIHIFTTFQVRNGDLEEVCFPNIKGHIDDIFKDYNKHRIYNWEFYIPKNNTDNDLNELGIKEVCIYKYNGLIILKVKEDNSIDNENIKKNNIDTSQIRGIYLDLEKNYLSKLFLRSKDSNKYITLEQYELEYNDSNTGSNDKHEIRREV
jgi:hypothetical protein